MDLTLVIMAAGIGSRFGGLKQITPVSSTGESIIDFSIFDAIRCGYNRVIIIIRKEIEDDFYQFFGRKFEKYINIEYAYQKNGSELVPGRTKPLGTADAILSTKDLIRGPFIVINADDFYGRESFQKGFDFFNSNRSNDEHALVGYRLKNTVSDHGSVSRAECRVNEQGILTEIQELYKIYKQNNSLVYDQNNAINPISEDTIVSMNFWCFQPSVIQRFQQDFDQFASGLNENPGAEFLIPDVCSNLIKSGKGSFEVIPTEGSWFGITYKEDFPKVSSGISEMIESGEYPSPLWK